MRRRTFNALVLGASFNVLESGSADEGDVKTRLAGRLLQSKQIETKLNGAVAWHVRYTSKDINDTLHEVTGSVIAPRSPGHDRPIVTWCHGTTGLGDAGCPSAQPDPAREMTVYFDPGASQQIDYGVPGVQSFIDAGYVVCATDYQGLGTSEIHHYMVSRTNARDAVFIAHAAKKLDVGAGNRMIAYGWSQGGGAAAALAELDDADFGDLSLRGSILLSPGVASVGVANPTGMAAAIADKNKAPDSHLLMTLWGLAASSPELKLTDVFTPLGTKMMEDSWRVQPVHHLGDMAARVFRLKGPILRSDPVNLPAWKAMIEKSSACRVKPRCPLLMCVDSFERGTVIPVEWQYAYSKAVQALGARIEIQDFPNDDHFSLPFSAQDVVADWIRKVLA